MSAILQIGFAAKIFIHIKYLRVVANFETASAVPIATDCAATAKKSWRQPLGSMLACHDPRYAVRRTPAAVA